MKRVYLIIPLMLIAFVITSQVLPQKTNEKSEIVSPPLPPDPPPPPPPPPRPYDETVTVNETPAVDEELNEEVPVVDGSAIKSPPPPKPPVPEHEENFQ